MLPDRSTRTIHIADLAVGGEAPIAVQSMAATRTRDVDATVRQVHLLEEAGADLVRIAVDSDADVTALAEVRARTKARLSVDLQENYRLATSVAPLVDKIRYNPGHLHHHERTKPMRDKVRFLFDTAGEHGLAVRIGVNAGSVAPEWRERHPDDEVAVLVGSALEHCRFADELGFADYVVSIKDSDPRLVIDANTRFASERPDVPLHLGVTEAGLPPDGIIKTRI
ncbi:MAG TPA: 4-hydroxy-3-methylbut-2-en-1-yl diphosphate synthase, partial [Planctomycetes bacterium]|nr:4-hydroxy-3-methylbut-2-en-1-yl diphosphate synthase [Planctomycetota bacterium]